MTRLLAGTDAHWRAECRQGQYARALIGIQTDLLGGPAIEVFRASPTQPWKPEHETEFFHDLTTEEQTQRLAADPRCGE